MNPTLRRGVHAFFCLSSFSLILAGAPLLRMLSVLFADAESARTILVVLNALASVGYLIYMVRNWKTNSDFVIFTFFGLFMHAFAIATLYGFVQMQYVFS